MADDVSVAWARASEVWAVHLSPWRATTTDVTQCIDRAGQALASQDLTPVQTDTVSIAGQSEATTAVFVCLETPGDSEATTVMVIVAGANDDQAVALREALKRAF